MKRSLLIGAIVGMIIGVLAVGSAEASPGESQRLRGIGGRSFVVEVTVTDVTAGGFGGFGFVEGAVLPNCYTFFDDGTWIDPVFVPGPWAQQTNGAATTVVADASLVRPDYVITLQLVGAVRPVPAATLGLMAKNVLESTLRDRVEFELTGDEVAGCS